MRRPPALEITRKICLIISGILFILLILLLVNVIDQEVINKITRSGKAGLAGSFLTYGFLFLIVGELIKIKWPDGNDRTNFLFKFLQRNQINENIIGNLLIAIGAALFLYGVYMIVFTFYAFENMPGGSASGFFIIFGIIAIFGGIILVLIGKNQRNKTN